MTQEEIQIVSVENADKRLTEIANLNFAISAKADYYNGLIQGFKDGAKLADKTLIEKVCEWISQSYTSGILDWKNCDYIIEDFKKAMEE